MSSTRIRVLSLTLLPLLLLAFGLSTVEAKFSQTSSAGDLITNGTVNDTDFNNDGTVYLGGSFTEVGSYGGYAVPIDPSGGSVLPDFDKFRGGIVRDVVPDGSGGWFVAGDFIGVGSNTANHVAHINSDGTLDTDWTANVNGGIYAVALNGDTLYLGGTFGAVNGSPRSYIAAVSASTGETQAWNPNSESLVQKITVSNDGNTVYVSGFFSSIGGETRSRLAALDAATGLATAWNPGVNSNIYDILISPDDLTLYVAGDFSSVAGSSRANLAAIDTITGLATAWDPNPNSVVYALSFNGDVSTIFVGGSFTGIAGEIRSRLAEIALDDATATSFNPSASSTVYSLEYANDTLYTGGDFTVIGGEARRRFAAFDGGSTLSSITLSASAPVKALSYSGANLMIGGDFQIVNGTLRNNAAAIDADGNLTSWDPNVGSAVYSLDFDGITNRIYLGGSFNSVGGEIKAGAAAVDATTGALITAWVADTNGAVNEILVVDNAVCLGGSFTSVNGSTRSRLAAVATTDGTVEDWNPSLNAVVDSLTYYNNTQTLYVGGEFTDIDGTTRNHLAAFDISTGDLDPWDPNLVGAGMATVYNIAVADGTVYIVGFFDSIGEDLRNRIASIDADTGLATDWNPTGAGGLGGSAYSVFVNNNRVYVGGNFSSINGTSVTDLAEINATTGVVRSWNLNMDLSAAVLSINQYANRLYFGGNFSQVNVNTVSFINPYFAILTEPIIQFSTDTISDSESTTSYEVEIGLSEIEDVDVTVDYTLGGSADGDGADYTLADGTATIPAGELTTTVTLEITDDILDETDEETVSLLLSNPTDAVIGDNNQFVYVIEDNDVEPDVGFTATSATGAESTTEVNVEVSLSAVSERNVSFDYAVTGGSATSGGTDYTLADGNLVISAGDLTGDITLTVVDDSSDESDETIEVTLSNAVYGTLNASDTFTYTITDDDVTIVAESQNTDTSPGGGGTGGSGPVKVSSPTNTATNTVSKDESGKSSTTNTPSTVTEVNWAKDFIDELVDSGAVEEKTTVSEPNSSFTRAEMIKTALIFFGYQVKPSYNSAFKDVDAKNEYSDYISAAKRAGIINGNPDGTFRPSTNVSRVEALQILFKAAGKSIGKSSIKLAFEDLENNAWYLDLVKYAFEKGIVQGKNPKIFAPNEAITKAELAKVAVKVKKL